ncbi:MAG: 2'-5' RNA ligase family protein [Elainellaceae cyanobacterium]
MTRPTSKSPRFFIALMLPPEVEAYANSVIAELRDRYQTRTARAAPHITLQPPFLWDDEPQAMDTLAQGISAIAAQHAPVPVCLEGFSAFKPRVLYIDVCKTEALLDLQSHMAHHLEAYFGIADPKPRPYTPHVTVASRNLSPGLFRRIWVDLRSRPAHFEFICDRLTLLVHRGQWHIHSDYALQPLTQSRQ